MVAVADTAEPPAAPESIWKTKVNCAVVLAGILAIVQVLTPLTVVHSNAGPEICDSDWNVKFVPPVTSSCTFSAAFGPLFVTKTEKGALEPADTWNGAKMGVQRSTAALAGSITVNLAEPYPLFEESTVFTVHVPT